MSENTAQQAKCPVVHTANLTRDAASRDPFSPSRLPLPKRGDTPVYYHHYLKLDQLLSAQAPKSVEVGGIMAHEEMLFIITHQTYELWFKQILHDLDSCREIFDGVYVPEKTLGLVVGRLERCAKILNQLVDQLSILETMTPLDFLDFREYLFPASGFQSVQFRLLEIMLGLRREQRLNYARAEYCSALNHEHKGVVEEAEKKAPLFTLVERWLERTPFLETDDFDFWAQYERSVTRMFDDERDSIMKNSDYSEDDRKLRLEENRAGVASFAVIFDENQYKELLESGKRRLSFRATKAAVLIEVYRDEPLFQMPHRLLNALLDIDEALMHWRDRHAAMVHRMLGLKMGTGGSSGYHYLRATATHHKVFHDFFNLSMYLIPRSRLPQLPQHIMQRMRFQHEPSATELNPTEHK